MIKNYPELNTRISEMAEGDEDFRSELTLAIFNGLKELLEKYQEGNLESDLVKIQKIRHKIKPTIAMFEFDDLADCLQTGKEILESEGFGGSFEKHFLEFRGKVEVAIQEVESLMQQA